MPSPLIAKPRLKTMHRRREAIIRMRGFSESNGVIEGGGRRKANWRQQPVCRLRNFTAYRLRMPAEPQGTRLRACTLFLCPLRKKETRDISPISSISKMVEATRVELVS